MSDNGVRRAPGVIVVGVDGSQGSARALDWALREARDRQAAVRVVTAWAWGGPAGSGRAPAPGPTLARQALHRQQTLVRTVLARFPGALPELTTELVQGDAASALIDRSRDGELLVLGSRGLGGTDVVVGSVADACLRHGGCPVVVVPGGEPALAEPPGPTLEPHPLGISTAALRVVGL